MMENQDQTRLNRQSQRATNRYAAVLGEQIKKQSAQDFVFDLPHTHFV